MIKVPYLRVVVSAGEAEAAYAEPPPNLLIIDLPERSRALPPPSDDQIASMLLDRYGYK